jgi:UDP-glucose 4-epimerase
MRVLVTGGAGFVGSHIVDRLLAEGDEVLVVDDMSTGEGRNLSGEVRLEELDIRAPSFGKLVSSFRPDLITHTAARASVPASMSDPSLDAEVNIVGGINVCQAALTSRCPQMIYVTTGGALYGTSEYLPCDEDHPIRPLSPYGLSKWTLELYMRMLVSGSVRLKVLRLANVYGPRQDPSGEAGVVAIFAQRMLRGERVMIFGNGEQTRDFVYVEDVARAHELAQGLSEPLTVNISSGAATTVMELFHRLAKETHYRLPPQHEGERPGDVKHVVLANSRAQRRLRWTPQTSLNDGLRETLAWLRAEV